MQGGTFGPISCHPFSQVLEIFFRRLVWCRWIERTDRINLSSSLFLKHRFSDSEKKFVLLVFKEFSQWAWNRLSHRLTCRCIHPHLPFLLRKGGLSLFCSSLISPSVLLNVTPLFSPRYAFNNYSTSSLFKNLSRGLYLLWAFTVLERKYIPLTPPPTFF